MRLNLQVGYDLTAGLPGHSGTVVVEAFGGDKKVSVISGQSSSLEPGLFIELDGQAYEIDGVDAGNGGLTLVEVRSRITYMCALYTILFVLTVVPGSIYVDLHRFPV